MAILETLLAKAKAAKKRIVLPEGQDPRVIIAANKIIETSVAKEIIVLGTEEEINNACKEAQINNRNFSVINHLASDKIESFAKTLQELRAQKQKDISFDEAIEKMKGRLFFGAMMVKLGEVDGMVSGSIASTGDLLRAAFMVVGTALGIKTASSAFIMDLAKSTPGGESTLLFADCAVNPNPDAETLVDIAVATAKTHKSLIGTKPKIAFLSFSTKGSASHLLIEKVQKAVAIMKQKVDELKLDCVFDGELQADAALVPKVASSKAPGSPLEGNANILIFPDLNSGNICYKITQRLAGAAALGPAMQGLDKPLNDLSRGCSSDDIVATAAITICQAI